MFVKHLVSIKQTVVMQAIHIIDVTTKGEEYTLDVVSTKQEALTRSRRLVRTENIKIDIWDRLKRFKTIQIR